MNARVGFLCGLVLSSSGLTETLRCPIRADTWVAMPAWAVSRDRDADGVRNHGRDPHLVIRGRESFALLDFDCAAARGLTVTKATLRVWREPDAVPLHTVGVSTVSGVNAWEETGASFYSPGAGRESWSYPQSELVDVTFAQSGSLYTYPRARDAGGGWWEIDIAPRLVAALVTGDQFGWMLTDEKGQTQTRHLLSSREGPHPPELLLEATREDRTPPGRVQALKRASGSTVEEARALGRSTLRPGSVILRFGRAGDDQGRGLAARYELRYSLRPITPANFDAATLAPRWMLNPLAPQPSPLAVGNALQDEVTAIVEQLQPGQNYYFAARAADEAGNTGPVSPLGAYPAFARVFPQLASAGAAPSAAGANPEPRIWAAPELLKIHPVTGALLEQSEAPRHRDTNAVWDGATGLVRLQGARNEFLGFQLAIESDQPLSGVEVRVSRPLFERARLPAIFARTGAIQLYREWFVPDEKNAWHADALVPLTAPLAIPAADNAVPGQRVQPIFVDVFVPHDAAPGRHSGALRVTGGGLDREVRIEVDVLPLRLPDKLNFVVDLNCYSGVDSGYPAQRGTPEYRALERGYYRVGHLHRANLDILGYSHTGTTVPDHAPPLTGEGAATRVADWTDWDAHFGPLVDGSAFSDLPRAGVPVAALYLPFFENWPGDLRKSYKFNDYPIAKTEEEYRQIITHHALNALPVEESFTREYQDRFSAVAADFARHINERGWTNSEYLVYFNNKYYYKRPAQGGHGVSWWLMDEPNHRDDVRANAFLSDLLKRGLRNAPSAPIFLRTDISRVDWIRDLMPGLIDINCVSVRFYEKNRYLRDDTHRFGKRFWNYASTNHPRETNVSMRAWCWRAWLAGADGIVPWNAVRGPAAWNRAEPLTVFYAGSKFGSREPFASLRLKAYRRGQQDIEYLTLLAAKKGWDRESVSRAAGNLLELRGEVQHSYEEDAGAVRFLNASDARFEALRERVARTLLEN